MRRRVPIFLVALSKKISRDHWWSDIHTHNIVYNIKLLFIKIRSGDPSVFVAVSIADDELHKSVDPVGKIWYDHYVVMTRRLGTNKHCLYDFSILFGPIATYTSLGGSASMKSVNDNPQWGRGTIRRTNSDQSSHRCWLWWWWWYGIGRVRQVTRATYCGGDD